MLKRSGTLFSIILALFIFNSCEFKVDEFPPASPPTGISIRADDVPLVDNFLYIPGDNVTRTLNAVVAGGEAGLTITWELVSGDDKVELLADQGRTVIVKTLEAGQARIKVTAKNSDGEFEMFFNILVGESNSGSAGWMFRVYDNGLNGFNEIAEGDEIAILFNEDRIIELRAVGTADTVKFTMTCDNPALSIYEVQAGSFIISGNVKNSYTVTVAAVKGTEVPITQTFIVRLIRYHPIPLLDWDHTTDPIGTRLTIGAAGTAHQIKNMDGTMSPYYFRARLIAPQITSDGAWRLEGSTMCLIIGGGNSMTLPNPAGTVTAGGAAGHAFGQLDLSHNTRYRLTVRYGDHGMGSGAILRVNINNNSTSAAYSPLDAGSNIRHFTTAAALYSGTGVTNANLTGEGSTEGTLIITINARGQFSNRTPAELASLETAFFALLNWTESYITITGIRLEELED